MNVASQIDAFRREWGTRLIILGHHYQTSAVLAHADVIGDSLELSRKAAAAREAERIVFCGVHFMAESAALLAAPQQQVYMPDVQAGCPMAEMADVPRVSAAWDVLNRIDPGNWIPVVYVNSQADLKAFCGARGGITCTSSNARKVLQWVLDQNRRIFFLPDEHLGTNTLHDMGFPDEAVVVYDPRQSDGGVPEAALRNCRMVAWKGFCRVHTLFTPEQVREVRRLHPAARVIVHPESPREVVRLADAHGSTAQIIDYVRAAPEGSIVVIGTERHLVERLAEEYRGRKTILTLWPSGCVNMARTNSTKLFDLLSTWPERNRIAVSADVAPDARLALDRMMRL
jgi:quinolinate synthase